MFPTGRYREPRGVRRYGLSIVLAALFLGSWAGQFVVQAYEYRGEQETHGESFTWGDFMLAFWRSTLENWQSEYLQLLSFVLLSAYLFHAGSQQSRSETDRLEAKVDEIRTALDTFRKDI